MALNSDKLNSDPFAYDLSPRILTKGEVYDQDAITVSIDNILSTLFAERLNRGEFGSSIQMALFEGVRSTAHLESILESVISSIKEWETRVIVLENKAIVDFDPDTYILSLKIPYIVKDIGILGSYDRNVRTGI